MSPLVSIIIPAYNRADYIDQTIQSVLEQSCSNVELIVIDDGSTDGTYQKIQSYKEKLILLTHDDHVNKGQSAAINLGLSRARGKYIAILDSDDYWAPDILEIQVEYLEKHDEIGMVYSNGCAVDAKGRVIYQIYDSHHIEMSDPNLILLDCYILLPLSSLVRKSVYERVGRFNEDFRAAQDHDMVLRIAEVTKLAYLPKILFYYRRHNESISSTNQRIRWTNGFKILEHAQQRYPYKASTIRKRRAVLNYRLGICDVVEKRYIDAAYHMIAASILDPLRTIKVISGMEKRN